MVFFIFPTLTITAVYTVSRPKTKDKSREGKGTEGGKGRHEENTGNEETENN